MKEMKKAAGIAAYHGMILLRGAAKMLYGTADGTEERNSQQGAAGGYQEERFAADVLDRAAGSDPLYDHSPPGHRRGEGD